MLDQATLAQLEAGYRSSQPQEQAAQQIAKPKVSGIKRLAANALPIVGGALGAIGGSFVAPVAGTAVGGAAGSALGTALKQRLLGEKTNFGEIATEGVLGAVPGILKGARVGVQAIKGARAAKKVTDAERAAQQIAETSKSVITPVTSSSTETARPSLLSKLSTSRAKASSGIKTDPGVGGIERADEATQIFQRLGITGTPTQQLRKINQTMASHGKQVDDILSKNPIQLDGTAVKAQVTKAIEDPLKYAELDLSTPGAQKALTAHLDKFAQAKTAKEVNDYVKTLNKVATKARSKLDRGGTLTDKEAAALAAKRSGDEVLSQYPEIAPLKKDMATLFERNADVTKASEKTLGVPILGIKSKTASQLGASANSGASKVLAAADKAASSSTAKGAKKIGGSLFNQFGTRAIASPLTAEDQSNQLETSPNSMTTSQTATQMPTNQMTNDNIPPLNPTNNVGASTTGIDYESEARNALAAGDYKAFDAIMSLAALAEKKATTGVNKPLSAEASKVIANANSGLTSLTQLDQMLQEDPGVLQKTAIPGRSAFGGAIGNVAGTASYDTAARNIADVITRLRTGAALTDSEEKFYKSQLPQAFDSPEVVQQKLQTFKDLFSSVANRTGSAGTDLQQSAGV